MKYGKNYFEKARSRTAAAVEFLTDAFQPGAAATRATTQGSRKKKYDVPKNLQPGAAAARVTPKKSKKP